MAEHKTAVSAVLSAPARLAAEVCPASLQLRPKYTHLAFRLGI